MYTALKTEYDFVDIEDVFRNVLQHKIQFKITNDMFSATIWQKTGKLILFKINYFSMLLCIENKKGNIEKIEIPIPFGVINELDDKKMITFSYKNNLMLDSIELNNILKELVEVQPTRKQKQALSKFFNATLVISILGG